MAEIYVYSYKVIQKPQNPGFGIGSDRQIVQTGEWDGKSFCQKRRRRKNYNFLICIFVSSDSSSYSDGGLLYIDTATF